MEVSEFDALAAQGYNRIPVSRKVLADLDTPLTVYHKLVDGPYAYLFESVEGGSQWGRYSIVGLPAEHLIRIRGHRWLETINGECVRDQELADPLAEVDALQAQFKVPQQPGLPKFTGGLVGYFGYETVRLAEPRLARSEPLPDQLGTDDILLMVSEEVAVLDNLTGSLHLVVNVDPSKPQALARAERRLDQLEHRLRTGSVSYPYATQASELDEADFTPGFSQDDFQQAVRRVQDYIAAGDVMQVVLSQRMSVSFGYRGMDVYRALRTLNPSPYLFYIDLDQTQIVGSSPEILVRLEDDEITVRPIAGTRPRGADQAQDQALAEDLLADPKEIAEHVMLIDLGRNDVGRVAETGTVKLIDRMVIERYSHVMHIVSQVTGQRRKGLSTMDVLRATLPAGTLSGAPKVRAMEIIQELEPVQRNVYGGAVGYIGWQGDMDTAIAIRTAIIQDGQLHVQAGAGIVADSDPAKEWEETMNKGRALFRAAARAASGLAR